MYVCGIPMFNEGVFMYSLTLQLTYIFLIVKRSWHLRVITVTCSVFTCSGELLKRKYSTWTECL